MKNGYLINFLTLCFMTSLALFTSDIYLTAFPLLSQSFHVDQDMIKFSLTIYLMGLCLCQVFVSYLLHLANQYRLSFIALGIFTLASLGIFFCHSIHILYALRFIQAFSAGVLTSTSRLVMNEVAAKNNENANYFSKVYISLGVAPIISPLLGSVLADFLGWRSIFLFLTFYGVAMFFLLYAMSKTIAPSEKTGPRPNLKKILSDYHTLIQRKAFVKNALIIGASFLVYFTFLCQAPFVLHALGLSITFIGALFVPISIAYIIASLWNMRLSKKIPLDLIIARGQIIFIIGALSLVIIALLPIPAYWTILPLCCMTFGNGFLVPTATYQALRASADLPQASTSLLGFLQLLPPIIGTFLLSALAIKTILGVSIITLSTPILLFTLPKLFRDAHA